MAIYRTQSLFSKKKKNTKPKEKNSDIAAGGALYGAGATGMTASGLGYLSSSGKSADSAVTERLLDHAAKNGVNVDTKTPSLSGPYYQSSNNTVYTGGSKSSASLAHELGHQNYIKNKNAGIIGKGAHKAYIGTGGTAAMKSIQPLAGIAAGVASGAHAAKLEAEGKKQNKIERHAGWAVPLALAAPALVSEAAASRKGVKLLKQSGASKELLKNAKKELGFAYGTYAGKAVANAGLGELSRAASYRMAKNDYKNKNKNKK